MTRSPSIHRARKLRQATNTPEQAAWQTLRNLRKHGFPVRRQHPVGGYIVDFAIVSVQMAIEIDGSVHGREDVSISDAERQADIERMGWRVLRLSAQEAMDSDFLWARVCEALRI